MSKMIKCPTCGKQTRPDYCSDECLYRWYERRDIIEKLEAESRQCEVAGLWASGSELRQQLQDLHLGLNAALALIKGENNDGIN